MKTYTVQLARGTVRFRCAAELAPQAEWLGETIKEIEQERGPAFFAPGKRIRLGWSMLTVVDDGPGGYWLHEPAFDKNPFEETRKDVTTTLTVIAQQNDAIEKLGVEPTEVSFQEKVVAATGSLTADHIYLERSEPDPEDADSGWFIGFADEGKDNSELEAIYVYQLLGTRPELLQMLTLPEGWMVVFDGDEVEAVLNEAGETVFPTEDE